jgi:ketosteroid isomerase-like protein
MGRTGEVNRWSKPMNDENRLLQLDNEWNESYPRRDVSALDRIIAEDWVCIDGAGQVITKRQLLERVQSSTAFFDPYKFDEIVLRMFKDSAIVTGRLSGTKRGNDGTFYLEQRYTRVYVRRNDRWQAVATQVTVVKEERVSENNNT